MSNQNLIERYVQEVGRNLPGRMRADVELELRSLLADSLEEQESDNSEQTIVDLLEELGPPAAFAANYLPQQHLIGPTLYPIFKKVLSIVISVIGALFLVLTVINLISGSYPSGVLPLVEWLFGRVWSFGETAVYIFGIIALVFTVLEWFGAGDTQEEWDPRSLPETKDPDQLKKGELIFGTVATILALVAFNFFPEWIGLVGVAGQEWGLKILWADGFYPYVPWFTALWVGELALKIFVLQYGRWQAVTRWVELGLQIFALNLLYRITQGPAVLIPESFDTAMKGILTIVIIIIAIDSVVKLYRIITRPSTVKMPSSNPISNKMNKQST